MFFAVIDLGTNTFNLLIAEKLVNNTFKKVFNTKTSVKIGEGSINAGYISEIPFQRGINALTQFKKYLVEYNVTTTYAFATSAIRSASNGSNFVTKAKEITNIDINVIDGNEEADLIYYGNKMAVAMTDDISLIMDIGGGSTEIILANKTTVFWKQSFLLGAARLLNKFNPSDLITPQEIQQINSYLEQEFQSLYIALKQYTPVELIGSSGAFDSVIDVIAGKFNTRELNDSQTEYSINMEHYSAISEKIKNSTSDERFKIKGLIDMRVDMIVISVILIDFILNLTKINKMRVSTFSLKEGVISKKLGLSVS